MKKNVIAVVLLLALLAGCMPSNLSLNEARSTTSTEPSNALIPSDATEPSETVAASAPTETMSDDFDLYSQILEDYVALVNYRFSESFEYDFNDGTGIPLSDQLTYAITDELEYRWTCMLAEMPGYPESTAEDFGYILLDINADGVPELFWVRADGFILAVFTIFQGKPILLDAYWPRYDAVMTNELQIYTSGSSGAAYTTFAILEISPDGDSLCVVTEFGTDGVKEPDMTAIYYEVADGEKTTISESRFRELLEQYPFQSGESWLKHPIIFLDISKVKAAE